MGMNTYTAYSQKSVSYMWKCSKCMKINHYHLTMSRSSIPCLSHSSAAAAGAEVKKELQKDEAVLLSGPNEKSRYLPLNLYGKCEYCGHKEKWHYPTNSFRYIFDCVLPTAIALAIGIATYFLTKSDRNGILYSILAFVIVLAFGFGILMLFNEHRDQAMRNMPASSFPVMTINHQPVVNAHLYREEKSGDAQ